MLIATLLQRLSEFFVDVTEDNVEFHLGDLFDPSHFRLRDVFLKTEILNALHLPFELKAGYVGDVKVEGFVGFVLGQPLTISVDNVCLVVGHKPVDWNNELAWRYAKELLVAIIHGMSIYIPMLSAKSKDPNTSNSTSSVRELVRWISNKVLGTIAQTTLKLERLHVRFESEYEGQTIAYGLHVPTFEFSTRDIDDQILKRREQHGVKYPSSSDENTACKRLYVANTAVYCDLNATSFVQASPLPTTSPSSVTGSAPTARGSLTLLTTKELYAILRQRFSEPFEPNAERDLALISALWLKLDFVRGESKALSSWALGAVDIVTEDIKVNGDLKQFSVLKEELARMADFSKRTKRRAWLPSWVDREQIPPPQVTLSSVALLPVVSSSTAVSLSIDSNPRRLNRAWLRGMWRYAAHCVLVDQLGKAVNHVQATFLGGNDVEDPETTRERYIALYTRSLDDEALKIALFGRALAPTSPRATDTKSRQPAEVPLSLRAPLSLAEQWELSDLVLQLPVKEQAEMRKHATKLLRNEYVSSQQMAVLVQPVPELSTEGSVQRSLVLQMSESNEADQVEAAPAVRRGSGAHVSPKHSDSQSTDAPSSTSSEASRTVPPLEFIANHHHHFTRSCAESSPTGSPTKQHSFSPPSPTHHTHAPFTHSASAPIARPKLSSSTNSSPTKAFSLRGPSSPTSLTTQKGFIETLLPPSLLAPTARFVPHVNWHIGPVSIRFHHRVAKLEDTVGIFSVSAPLIPPRSPDTFIELHVDGCTGCALLCRSPSVSLLVELRLGLIKLGLIDMASTSTTPTGNAISTEYIREPSDGFLYLGLKYNFKDAAPRVPTSLLAPPSEDLSWDVKAKLCVGTIRIEYNDMALQSALRTGPRRDSLASNEVPLGLPIRIESATHVTIIQDVLHNWKSIVQQAEKEKKAKAPTKKDPKTLTDETEARKKQLHATAKKAQLTKLLHALMVQSSCVDVDLGGMEVVVSVLTSNVVERLRCKSESKTHPPGSPLSKQPLPLFDSEQVSVTIPPVSAGLQNRPLLNECQVYGAGVRVKCRTTKQGRAAVIDHILRRVFPSAK